MSPTTIEADPLARLAAEKERAALALEATPQYVALSLAKEDLYQAVVKIDQAEANLADTPEQQRVDSLKTTEIQAWEIQSLWRQVIGVFGGLGIDIPVMFYIMKTLDEQAKFLEQLPFPGGQIIAGVALLGIIAPPIALSIWAGNQFGKHKAGEFVENKLAELNSTAK